MRLLNFTLEKTKPYCIERHLENNKSVEPTTFLPCRSVLTQHIKRAWYIAKLYKSASEAYSMNELTPTDYGWKLLEVSNLNDVWFERQQVPQEIEDIKSLDESDDEAIDYESDEKENGSNSLMFCNFIKNRLKHRSFHVKFAKFLKTPILRTGLQYQLLIVKTPFHGS